MTKIKIQKTHEQKIPKLRFPGFTGAWEEKKLSEIFKINRNRNTDDNEKHVLTNSAVEGIVNQRDYFDKDIANQNNLTNYFIVDIDDFIYNPRISKMAPVGPFKRNKLQRGIMSPLYTILKPKIGDFSFLENYFQTRYWHRYMFKIANYGARHDRMNILQNDFMRLPVPFPTSPEQKKITSFLSSVDGWIENLYAQRNTLQDYKKGIMQKIFTQEIRYKDDNGKDFPEWRQKRLSDIATFRRGSFPQPYGLPKWYDSINGMPFVQVFDVDDNMKLKEKTKQKISEIAKSKSVYVKKGSIILTIQGSIGRIARTQYDAYVDRTLLIFQTYKEPMDKTFFLYLVFLLFETEKRKAPGGTIKTITKEALSSFKVNLPILQEQQKVASFLSSIDNMTEAKQKQISYAKEWKKGLMQGLFI